ncbi:MAG: nucleoside triphosphate pyrophosphohydrolase [Candidatus Neomarinimicrobiota bacterium]|nr:nucleoside triphosphate pyrophosphohydrolase [Candidatus Neomarinimicrobiota bacterium]
MKNNLDKQIKMNFQELDKIIKKLRSSEGCDWDKSQTSDSLLPYFIEEVYELIDSIDKKDYENTKEELGDVMLHLIFQSQIAAEKEKFTINDVIESINKKLINRHPHVFAHIAQPNSGTTNRNWETQKYLEKDRDSRLDGVPNILPSIIFSQRIQEKASHAGFDWEGIDEVWEKLDEEINELRFAQKENDINKIREEIGDLLFTVINLSRFFGISAENALRGSNNKFIKRFQLLEKIIFDMNKNINDFSSNELDELWKEAKKY